MIDAIVLAVFFGAVFLLAFVTSLPRQSPGAIISRRILHTAFALAFVWMLCKELVRFFR